MNADLDALSKDYRARVYQSYVNGRDQPLAPSSLEGLRPRMPLLEHIMREYIPKDRETAILELGCGHGAFLYALEKGGYVNCQGVDCAPEQVAAAQRLGINGVTEANVMTHIGTIRDESKHVIVAFDLIEHFTKPELICLVDEVFRILLPGGVWIIHAPNGGSPFCARTLFHDFTHELAFTSGSLSQLLLSSGFSSVVCTEDGPRPHGFISGIRWLLWKVLRSCLRFYLAVETGATGGEQVFTQNLIAVATK